MMWPRFQEKMWVSQTKQASTKSVRQVARWVRSKKWRIRSSGVSDCKEREPASGGSGDDLWSKCWVHIQSGVRRTFGSPSDAWAEATPAFISLPLSTGSAVYRTYMTIDPWYAPDHPSLLMFHHQTSGAHVTQAVWEKISAWTNDIYWLDIAGTHWQLFVWIETHTLATIRGKWRGQGH